MPEHCHFVVQVAGHVQAGVYTASIIAVLHSIINHCLWLPRAYYGMR